MFAPDFSLTMTEVGYVALTLGLIVLFVALRSANGDCNLMAKNSR